MRVACFQAVGKEPEHVSLGYLKSWLLGQRLRDPAALRIFGFDVEVTPADRDRGYRGYEAWASVPDGVRPSGGVRIRRVLGGLYAVLRVPDALVDPYARIPTSWKRLATWVERSHNVRLTEGLCLEEENRRSGSIHLDLFLPVARIPRARPPGRRRVLR